jgi:hypothetical protein
MLKLGLVAVVGVCALISCGSATSAPPDASGGSDATAGSATTAGGANAMSGAGTAGKSSMTPTGDVTTPAGFCQSYHTLLTEMFASCLQLSDEQSQRLFADPGLCRRFEASITEKRMSFDGTRAAACLEEAKAASTCNGTAEGAIAPHCELLHPLVTTGGTCNDLSPDALGDECTGDDYCQPAESNACSGTCAGRAPIGAACDPSQSDVRCAVDATCDRTTKKCVALPGDVELDGACGSSVGNCKTGLFCDRPNLAANGACHVPQTSGPCNVRQACALPAICAGPVDAMSCVLPKQLGEACTPGFRECNILAHCDTDHVCSDKLGAVGETCGLIDGEGFGCQDGAYCAGFALNVPGTCQATKQAGAACDGSSAGECGGWRAHCDMTTLVCKNCD